MEIPVRSENDEPWLWYFPDPIGMIFEIILHFIARILISTESVRNDDTQIRRDKCKLVEFFKPILTILKFDSY
jgi:hypothetical protein